MQLLKRIIRLPTRQLAARRHRARFDSICRHCGLTFDYELNSPGLSILEEVFVQRMYADHFPFYQQNNVLDVGGHFGYFAIFAALNSAQGSRIVTVEPSEHNARVLRANIERMNLGHIQIVHGAVAEESGTAKIYLGPAHNCSLIAEHAQGLKTDNRETSELVSTFSLADVLSDNNFDSVDVLKMDCEGAEYAIVFASPESVLRRVRVIMMEFHDLKDAHRNGLAMINQLTEKGFQIAQFHHLPTNMNLNYGKIIAIRD
jgi:FkbM family methyltransferase